MTIGRWQRREHHGRRLLAGFTASPEMCGGNGYCLVLAGATEGNNSFAMLALLAAYEHFQDTRYLDAARTIGRPPKPDRLRTTVGRDGNVGEGGS